MNRLKKVRLERNYALEDIEEKIGIDRAQYEKYENGDEKPTLGMWLKLAVYFNVPVAYLQGVSRIKDINILMDSQKFAKAVGVPDVDPRFINIPKNEMKAAVLQENLHDFEVIKKAILDSQTISSDIKLYDKKITNLDDPIEIDEITGYTIDFFKLLVNARTGDKKAQAVCDRITKRIDKYFGYDKEI